jgi:hypothetical protein
LGLIFSWKVVVLIYISNIGGVDMFFYAPIRGIFHIDEESFKVGELVGVDSSMRYIHLFNFDTCGRVMVWDLRGGMLVIA